MVNPVSEQSFIYDRLKGIHVTRLFHGCASSGAVRRFGFYLRQTFSHGFSFEYDVMGIVHESVEDGIGEGWIFHRLVPVFDGHLAGDDGGVVLMSVVKDFDQILLLVAVNGGECPVVKYLGHARVRSAVVA